MPLRSVRAAFVVALLLSACGGPSVGFGVALTLRFDATISDTTLAAVDSFTITAAGDETYSTTVTLPRAPMRIERTIYRPDQATRNLTIDVVALDGHGTVVALGASKPLVLSAGKTTTSTIDLVSPDGSADAGTTDAGDGGKVGDGGIASQVALYAGTPGGGGCASGIGAAAFFDQPTGVAVDAQNFYVVDNGSSTLFAIDRTSLSVTRVAGSPWRPGLDATHFAEPRSAVVMGSIVYITDSDNEVVRSWDGTKLLVALGDPQSYGPCSSGELAVPRGITTDGTLLYIVNNVGATVCVGNPVTQALSAVAGTGTYGYMDGDGTVAEFQSPTGVSYLGGSDPTLAILDANNRLVRSYDFGSTDVSTLFGKVGVCGDASGPPLSAATICEPEGIASVGTKLYFTDIANQTVRVFDPAATSVTVLAGTLEVAGSTDGTGTGAKFNGPHDLVSYTDPVAGPSLLVADTYNHLVRSVATSSGKVVTIAGSSEHPGGSNGDRSLSTFATPLGLASSGATLYVADSANSAIRAIASNAVTTVSAGGSLQAPTAIAVGADGLLFVADSAANAVVAVQPLTGTQKVVVSGTAASDGGTLLSNPQGIAIEGTTLYVSDTDHDLIRTFSINGTATGTIDLGLAGMAHIGCSTQAGLDSPAGLAVDATTRTLYVAAYGNCMIFAYDIASGNTAVVAGDNVGATDGQGGAATFNHPIALALDGAGGLFVADYDNALVRRIALATSKVSTYAGIVDQAGFLAGPVATAHLNRTAGVAFLPGTGLIASLPSENSLVVVK